MKRFMQKKRKLGSKGFTLIELIVVIAVIGILVLLAAPKFLGYTKDANVAAMKADVKVLENAALIYAIDPQAERAETWPISGDEASYDIYNFDNERLSTHTGGFAFDETNAEFMNSIKSLKNDISEYIIITEKGDFEGKVFHLSPIDDSKDSKWQTTTENTIRLMTES